MNRKTIIFDFGNILIDLDFPRCFEAFRDILGVDFSNGLPPKTQDHLHRYERGQLNTEGFLWHLQQYDPEAEIRDIIAAWNSILGTLPMGRLELVQHLRKEYNVAILSNINDLHEQYINNNQLSQLGIKESFYTTFFDTIYYSHHIGMRKPDDQIYAHVQNDLEVLPTDILFIDDMPTNIEACQQAGWHGIVHDPKEEIIDKIDDYLLQVGF